MNKNVKRIWLLVAAMIMIASLFTFAAAEERFVCEHGIQGTLYAPAESRVQSVKATCTEAGVGYTECDQCVGEEYDSGYSDLPVFTKVVIPATDHNYVDGVCDACGEAEEVEVEAIACPECKSTNCEAGKEVAATCKALAYTVYTCTDCGEEFNVEDAESVLAPHTNTVLSVLKAADCTKDEPGIDKMFCLVCEAITYEENLGHSTYETYADATCEKNTWVVEKCSICGDIVKEVREIPNTQKTCGLVDDNNMTFITVAPKDYKGEDKDKFKAPTCTEEGYGYEACEYCGKTKSGAIVPGPIAKLAHDWEVYDDIYVPAGCLNDAGMKKICKVCGEEGVEELAYGNAGYDEAIGQHTLVTKETVPATCKAKGYIVEVCSVCKAEVKTENTDDVDKINGHEKKLISSLKDATCEEAGIGKYECALCKASLGYQEIPAAHTRYTVEETAATCTKPGKKVERCIYECIDKTTGKLWEDVTTTDALGHDYSVEATLAATCEFGTRTGNICSVCADESQLTEIPNTKLPHKWADVKKLTGSAYSAYDTAVLQQCSVCKTKQHVGYKTNTAEDGTTTVVEEAIDHDYDNVTGNYNATCATDGWKDKSVCKICGYVANTGVKVDKSSALHEVAPSKLVSTLKAADCKNEGIGKYVCKYCEGADTAKYYVIPVTHELYTVEEKLPTCGDEGYRIEACVNGCKLEGEKTQKTTILDPVGEHVYELKTIPATCTEAAKIGEVCVVCGDGEEEMEYVDGSNANGCKRVLVKEIDDDEELEELGLDEYDYVVIEKCSVCDVIYHTGYTINEDKTATPNTIVHEYDEDDDELNGNYDATCVAKGLEGRLVCTICGYVDETNAQETPIDPTNHAEDLVVMEELKAGTCSDTGIGKYGCPACEKITSTSYVVTDKVHDLVEIERVEPTCAVVTTEDADGGAGYVKYKCANGCSDFTGDTDNDPKVKTVVLPRLTQHTLVDSYELATCTEAAKIGQKCSVCGYAEYDTVPGSEAKGHDFDVYPVKESCLWEAGLAFDCKRCDHYDVRLVGNTDVEDTAKKAVAEHDEVRTPVDVTCQTDGYTIVTCKNCDYYAEVDKVTHNANTNHVSIPAENPLKPATCTEDGIGKHICKLCGVDTGYKVIKAEHDWILDSVEPATCGKAGKEIYVCAKGCTTEDAVKEVTLNPTNEHVIDDEEDYKEATCTEPAKTGNVCEVCGEIVGDYTVVAGSTAKGHTEVPVADKAPTCQEPGYKNLFKCDVCGEMLDDTKGNTFYEVVYADAENPGHVYNETVISAATCAATGISKFECTLCPSYKYEVTKVDHTWSEEIPGEACVYKYCTVCGELEIVNQFTGFEGPDFDCEWTGMHTEVAVEGADATCTEPGLTDGTKCSVCQQPVVAQVTIDALGHAWDEGVVTVEPTLEAEGEKVYTCGTCGATETEVLDKITHVCVAGEAVEENRVEATCEADGSYEVVVYCTDCGAEMGRAPETIPALGHAWDDGVVTVEPTLEAEGEKTYTCGTCSATKTEAVDKITHVHEYTSEVTEATCEEGGYTTYTCAECGDTYVADEVPALGHDYATEVTEATCEEGGYTTYTCGVCGNSYKADEVEALGHVYGEGVVTKATCTEGGYTTYTCGVCGDSYEADEVEAAGHDFADATCTSAKKCTVCGETEGEAKGHSWKNPTYDYNEDYSEEYVTYTCSGCGEKKTETNPF